MALFGGDGVADAVVADLVIARDALLFAPLAQLLGEFRALDVLVRDEVVGRDQDLELGIVAEHHHHQRVAGPVVDEIGQAPAAAEPGGDL